jgi:transcription elongation GreA/GreB family factor/very-short-patch-repair endonuclease
LLEFFQNTKPQEIAGIDRDELERRASQDNRGVVKPPAPFDSWFEVDVALELLRKGFVVLPQHEVATKRIDLVVEGGQTRLAIECDDDEWHGADQYEADMQRQRQLERCGWVFYRVRESAFRSNKDRAMDGLWRVLKERDIYPHVNSQEEELGQQNNPNPEMHSDENFDEINKVCIGSRVTYVNEDDGVECQVQIVSGQSNPEWGTINSNTPIAVAILGAEVGQMVIAHLPVGSTQLKIISISRP